ncbi:MAG: acetyl-CoA carboxylase carboxyl transferase subunit alpha [Flavobacteriaceae bacterium]|nr:MAG: acetyl-CoA carboxylase carboxyl transferase subunit alpha [Flavobacteriaceae bacterium]
MEFLDFEQPIQELMDQYQKCLQLGEESGVDIQKACLELEKTIEKTKKQIYSNLTPWQRVQLSRHPDRPYSLDYIQELTDGNFIELFGDRLFADDKAMIGGLGKIDGQSVMFVGQQKGRNTKDRQKRRFGMPNPDGYRKALRLMKLAEKFGIPIVTLIDTPGAFPGLEAEERGQGEAIAKNIIEMMNLRVPVVSFVIGEGASGGALGIGVGNLVYMLENTWYSVISPESCSSILWRSWEYKEQAAAALKLTPQDMKKMKIVDGIIQETLGGAHWGIEETANNIKKEILSSLQKLSKLSQDQLVESRQNKFIDLGVFKG